MSAKGLIIGAARSGSGKTSVTIGLLRAFARRGIAVRGAKSGPDYIDPGFHAAATGRPGVNLDSWAMHPSLLAGLAGEAASGANLVIVESAMGLFDGIPGDKGRSGAASDLAGSIACRSCWCSTSPASHRLPLPSPRVSRPTILMSRSPAWC